MGKKMGLNSKAVAAKDRKNEKAASEKAAKEAAMEDAKWVDDNKQLAKKQARKDEAEKKRLEALEKKKERDEMLAQESQNIAKSQAKANPVKVTRAQITELQERREDIARGKSGKPELETHLTAPLVENVNRLEVEGAEARNIEEAISVLKVSDDGPSVDKHPEKRMKAAYEDFESRRLPELKSENPSMRLSQLKQMLRKEWQKNPDNPLNRAMAAAAAASRN